MRLFVVVIAVLAVFGIAAGSYSVAQETPATPDAGSGFCATPEASPEASPATSMGATPDVITDASPAEVASEVVAEVANALDVVTCATPAATTGGTDQAATGTVQLEAYDIGWRTSDQPGPQVALTVTRGSTIQINSSGAAPHNFDLKALGLFVDLPPGASGDVVIPSDAAPGEYEFICSVPGHAQAGMVGTLTIQ